MLLFPLGSGGSIASSKAGIVLALAAPAASVSAPIAGNCYEKVSVVKRMS